MKENHEITEQDIQAEMLQQIRLMIEANKAELLKKTLEELRKKEVAK